ncbi:DUF305 domain-containing protein [Candidatus Parcubacteria bacterium]|nr:MAG: DUF305 domain-containing protein [Candidatus Parcubacteria bacterium]
MNKQTHVIFIGLLALVIGFGGGYLIRDQRTPGIGNHMMPDGSMMSQNIDQHFIVQMIPHHEGAIAMAEIALERSKRPEIISLANGIIEAQQKEIIDMQSWYQSWFGSAPPQGGMGMMHMGGMEGDTAVLASIPAAEFDREFIEQMIPHHEMAIMMAQMLQASTERAEMKQLGDNIITSQSREIQQMANWLTTWASQ